MNRHLTQRYCKRTSNMNELVLSPSLHHIRHRKQARQATDLNLPDKDFLELRQALKTIFHLTKSKVLDEHQQRLTSPYLQTSFTSFLPLYTNEYFIRNGLLNHNDRPEIYENSFPSRNLCYSKSSMNISLPLTLLSNPNYLFTALTNNFTSDKCQRSQSNIELYSNKYHDEDETESMIIRRNKVQTWERENILQHDDQYHRSSILQTPSIVQDKESISLPICIKEEKNENDDLFPMVKMLAPYIIIRDSSSKQSANIDSQNNEKPVHLIPTSEKQSLNPLLLPSSSPINQTRQERVEQRQKNYLLAEFESVLTQLSKK